MTFFAILLIVIFVSASIYLLLTQDTLLTDQNIEKNIASIEKLLAQTQCGDCGFNGCHPYAEAIATKNADINRCLPGGDETIKALAQLTGADIKPLYKKTNKYMKAAVALIEEEQCIGCVKCINACPVDAIMGAPKQMHSVIDMYCTGCELCIPPCPVDCISMVTN